MNQETERWLFAIIIIFMSIAVLKLLGNPKPEQPPKCEDYGYDEHTTIVMNKKNSKLIIICQ